MNAVYDIAVQGHTGRASTRGPKKYTHYVIIICKPHHPHLLTADKGQISLSEKLPVPPISLFLIPNIVLVYEKCRKYDSKESSLSHKKERILGDIF